MTEAVLAQLIDRHNDLVQAWEDNEDPDIRSQISFEIRRLDAQINQLTERQRTEAEQPTDVFNNGGDVFDDREDVFDDRGDVFDDRKDGFDDGGDEANDGRAENDGFGAVPGEPDRGAEFDLQDRPGHDNSVQPMQSMEAPFSNQDGIVTADNPADHADNWSPDPVVQAGPSFEEVAEFSPDPDRMAEAQAAVANVGPETEPVGHYHFDPDQNPQTDLAAPAADQQPSPPEIGQPAEPGTGQFIRPSGPVLAVVGVSLALLAGVLWFGRQSQPNETQAAAPTTVVTDPAGPSAAEDSQMVLSNVRAVLDGLGLTSVVVDERQGTIHIGGPVPARTDYDAAATAARAVAGNYPIDTSALVVMAPGEDAAPAAPATQGRSEALQLELDRLLAANPLIFNSGQASLTELHQRILNNAVLILTGYPGLEVTVVGYTDDQGDDVSNQGLSLARAENVKAYLGGQGIPGDSIQVKAVGEQATSGSEALARLERRVEFEVTGAETSVGPEGNFRVAIVAPSASNDLAFTQSMVDAVNLLATEMTIEVAVTDNTFVPDEAAEAVRSYAELGYDLVIAHGSQFGAALIDLAPQYPETAFAWGTASDTFGLPNVYAYDAAAQEGGYVLGALSSILSTNKVAGVVGPIEVGDAAQYIAGFDAGARAENPGTNVLVSYTGSFSDIALATETAQNHMAAGADVLTGSAQMVVGAISTADQQGALWFGTQANQASLAPATVVASQVYHWEVALRPILADISAGRLAGTTYTANLANGGLVIEYNPDYPLPPEARQRADDLTAAIASGSIAPPGS